MSDSKILLNERSAEDVGNFLFKKLEKTYVLYLGFGYGYL